MIYGNGVYDDEVCIDRVPIRARRERYLRPDEVADIFRVSPASIFTMARAGQIRSVKLRSMIRIPLSALDELPSAAEVDDVG